MSASDAARCEPSARRRWLIALPLVVFAALALLFFARLHAGDPSRLPSALIGREAPALAMPPVEGLSGPGGAPTPGLTPEDLRGQPSIVNVWASWCVPCRDEHPFLVAIAESEPDIALYGINYKDAPGNARRFLGQLGNPFDAVGADRSGRAAIEWGVYGVPETFVLDADGRIVHKHVGPIDAEAWQSEIRPALDKAREGRAPRSGA